LGLWVQRHEAAEEHEARVVPISVDDVLPRVSTLVGLDVKVVALVVDVADVRPVDRSELTHARCLDTRLLVELAREALFQRLAGIEPARRHLEPRRRNVAVLEHEQLMAAGDVGDDAKRLQCGFARSDAL
jgi:hypothetical protein